MFDDFEPIAFVYGGVGIIVGILMMKLGGSNINIPLFWKILTVLGCGVGAFILGMIQSGD